MGRLLLISRLAIGDIRRRRTQSALLVVMIAATTATLTLGLALHGVTDSPWARTRAATNGPDVRATSLPALDDGAPADASVTPAPGAAAARRFAALAHAPGVAGASGPYPLALGLLTARGLSVLAQAEGRDSAAGAIDQPRLTAGRWTRPGGAVVEQGLAGALGVGVGDAIRLAGRAFTVTGIAVSTAQASYPGPLPGLIWLTRADTARFATPRRPLGYAIDLKLADPAAAPAFAARYREDTAWFVEPWQQIRSDDAKVIAEEQRVLLVVSWLLALLAIAGIAVLVGGRMAEQTRRVGLLKAVGATPWLVAVVLLAENLVLALVAAAAGLAIGELLAPSLIAPVHGLLGSPGAPSLTAASAALVALTAVAVAAGATIAPALRGARTSTVRALAEPANPPRRRPRLIALSARLPVPLLLGLRLIARRTRRSVLGAASLTIAVTMIVATLTIEHKLHAGHALPTDIGTLPGTTMADRLNHVVLTLSLVLVVLAAINAIVTAWTTVIDAQRPTALARALGATPRQVTAGLATAQLLPALAAACLGIPTGLLLYDIAGGGSTTAYPPLTSLLAVIPATLIAVTTLTAIPARLGTRRPIAEVLRSD
jgi:putative ABC transport system permease protein